MLKIAKGFAVGVAWSVLSINVGANAYEDYWGGKNLSAYECVSGTLVNTTMGLPRCMQVDNVIEHLTMFNDIANANDGSRAAAHPGYQQSLEYVKATLEKYDYTVSVQPFPFSVFRANSPGILTSVFPDQHDYTWEVDFNYLEQSSSGDVQGAVVAVDLSLGLDNNTSSGCEAHDFVDFPVGSIALLQRGNCTFRLKAENAADAGAVGVIIFNQGNTSSRTGLMNGDLTESYSGNIPVFFATYDLGVMWSQINYLQLTMKADVFKGVVDTYNVIAESTMGNPDNIVMAGAHLDSVSAGAGINDNASGSATLLELAVLMSKAKPNNKMRFAWWGAEESGLLGSTYYVNSLSEAEQEKIKVYLNFDMLGSTNGASFIYDGDGSDFGLEGPPGSAATERIFENYYRLRGVPSEGSSINFRSDYAQFFNVGIAFGGLFSGAGATKSEQQADKFGGVAGAAFDACYHQHCDNINNINTRILEVNADAAAYAASWLSHSTLWVDRDIERARRAEATNTNKPVVSKSVNTLEPERWGDLWRR